MAAIARFGTRVVPELPQIIKEMGGLSDLEVGFLSAVPPALVTAERTSFAVTAPSPLPSRAAKSSRAATRSTPCRWACRTTSKTPSPKAQRWCGWVRRYLGSANPDETYLIGMATINPQLNNFPVLALA